MNKIRFGIIGVGGMGSPHASYMNTVENACLAAICDLDKTKLDKHGPRFEVPTFERYQDLLDSGKADAVLIATPHYIHTEIAEAAFARGLHVLCEKPVAVGVKAARRINEVSAKHPKLKFGIMFQQRTSPVNAKMRQIIADGELGDICRITMMVTAWFRTWSYYASGGWRATWAGEGGGVLLNQCPHSLDQLQWVPNLIPSRVTAVASIAKTHPIEVEDEVSAILEYENGAIGHFITSTGEAPGTDRFEVCGDRGKLVNENGRLMFYRTQRSVQEINQKSPDSFPHVETWPIEIPVDKNKPQGHKVVTQNFVNAILKDEPLLAPGTDGVKSLEIGNAMLWAGLTRQARDLPLDGDGYDAFIQGLIKTYGGKKTLQSRSAVHDMGASFK